MKTFIPICLNAILISFIATSCKQIYCCGFPSGDYLCTKSTDTVHLHISGATSLIQQNINDSLTTYSNKGYRCTIPNTDTLFVDFNNIGDSTRCVTGKAEKDVVKGGMFCREADAHDNDGCNCY